MDLAANYSSVIPAIGVHPWYINNLSTDWASKLENLLKNNSYLWLGECGVDRLKNKDMSKQLEILKIEINLAQKYQRPLILHAVKSDVFLQPLLPLLPQKTIFHSFTGSAEWGMELQKHGFYLGLNFSILRKKNHEDILRRLNPRLLLLETDGPYQSGHKDIPSLPQNLPLLADKISSILNFPLDEFLKILYANWQDFKGV